MGSLDRYTCPRCGLSFVSGDNSIGFVSEMISVWCTFCSAVHDFSFPVANARWGQAKLLDISVEQRRKARCLKPDHRPYLLWHARDGCPHCSAELSRELLLDFD